MKQQLELFPAPNYNQIIDDLSKLIMVGALAYIALKKDGKQTINGDD
jgi:hypothetical protein